MRHIVLEKNGDRVELHTPVSSAALFAAVSGWWPEPDLCTMLAVERLCEAASGVDECPYFGKLTVFLGVEVSWVRVDSEDRCLF